MFGGRDGRSHVGRFVRKPVVVAWVRVWSTASRAACWVRWLWKFAVVDRVQGRRVLETTVSGASAVMVAAVPSEHGGHRGGAGARRDRRGGRRVRRSEPKVRLAKGLRGQHVRPEACRDPDAGEQVPRPLLRYVPGHTRLQRQAGAAVPGRHYRLPAEGRQRQHRHTSGRRRSVGQRPRSLGRRRSPQVGPVGAAQRRQLHELPQRHLHGLLPLGRRAIHHRRPELMFRVRADRPQPQVPVERHRQQRDGQHR